MYDSWNPSADEVREWAYDPDALEPCQDWDLVLSWAQHERAYLELATDNACPKRQYFLALLYFIVGNAVRSKFRSAARPIIVGFIERGVHYSHPDIALWQHRSRQLLDHPEQFKYDDWCAGGLARGDT